MAKKFRYSYLAQKNGARFIKKKDAPKFRARGFKVKKVKTPLTKLGGRPKRTWKSVYDAPVKTIRRDFKRIYGKYPTSLELQDIVLYGEW